MRSGANRQSRPSGPAARPWIWKQVGSSFVASMTGDGAETIRTAPHSPIQSMWRWPCIATILPPRGRSWRTNQLPLISAVPIRSEKARGRPRVFHEVVVEGHDPTRPGELPDGSGQSPRLFG